MLFRSPPSATPRSCRLRPRARGAAVVLLCAGFAVACGKKGPPLAPLLRVPAKVSAWNVSRADEAVFLTLTVPTANVGGDQPADLAAIEIYAATIEGSPPALELGRVPAGLALVTSAPVRRPLPPPPTPKDGAPALPELPREPGLDQGVAVTFLEQLTLDLRQPVTLTPGPGAPVPAEADAGADGDELHPALSLPAVFVPASSAVRRHYVAVAVSRRGRRGAWSDWKSVPVGPTSGAPRELALTYDEAAIAVTWTPAPDARQAPPAPADGVLDARPFGAVRPPTRYNVYAAGAAATPAAVTGAVTRSAPLNDAPFPAAAFTLPGVTFGSERCVVVRPLDTIDGVEVEGPASAPGCVTPADTFAPAAPAALEAVAGAAVISLIWDAVEAPDLAGYLVFRGTAPGEPTTPLTPAPISATSFEDRAVAPGVRYVYVVVAVDSATPVNRSAPSNRVEETARQ